MLYKILEEASKPLINKLTEAFATKAVEKLGDNIGDAIGKRFADLISAKKDEKKKKKGSKK